MDWFDIIKQTRVKNIEGLIRELYKVTADPNAHTKITGQLTEDKLNAAIAAAKQKPNKVPLPPPLPQSPQSPPLPPPPPPPPQSPPPPQQQQSQQQQQQSQQPANAQQKKKLSDRVKATLQRRGARKAGFKNVADYEYYKPKNVERRNLEEKIKRQRENLARKKQQSSTNNQESVPLPKSTSNGGL